MACPDCFNNCDEIISDQCVKYTGDPIEILGICTGDTLSKVEAAIITALLSALDGTGITVNEVTLANCPWLNILFIGKNKTLANLLQLLVDANCTLKELIDDISPSSYSFNTYCLENLPENPTSDDILQAVVTLICSIKTTVDAFPETYVKIDDLDTLIQNYLNTSNGGGGSVITYNQRLVPYVAMAYFGPLSNFNNGIGIPANGFDKVYICNGDNGTPDMRGRVVVGAVRNIPGTLPLDAAVDPALMANINYAQGDKFGENYHALTAPENAPHTHSVNDPGHVHTFPGVDPDGRGSDGAKAATRNTKQTDVAYTGITIGSSGSGLAHENRQTSIAGVWIMYIP